MTPPETHELQLERDGVKRCTALLGAFLNAWATAVNISHNKEMEYLNNPTPEVVFAMVEWKLRLKRLQSWSSKRWGASRVGKLIHDREHASTKTHNNKKGHP